MSEHPMDDRLTFVDELDLRPVDVPRAALRFARAIAYPDLDVDRYLNRLEKLATRAGRAVGPYPAIFDRARALSKFLFQRLGFRGNRREYTDPRNSFLNEVLDRRLGIPISLSTLYIAVARHCHLRAEGVGLPGHFIVRVKDPTGDLYLDPFHGGVQVSIQDCARLVEATTGYRGPFRMTWLVPPTPRGVLARMLCNLRDVYAQRKDWERAIVTVEHLRAVQPDAAGHLRDLGLLHHYAGSLGWTVRFLEAYLRRRPEAADAEAIQKRLRVAAHDLARLN